MYGALCVVNLTQPGPRERRCPVGLTLTMYSLAAKAGCQWVWASQEIEPGLKGGDQESVLILYKFREYI